MSHEVYIQFYNRIQPVVIYWLAAAIPKYHYNIPFVKLCFSVVQRIKKVWKFTRRISYEN